MSRAKAAWEVCAGVIPGEPMPEYSKTFNYTDSDLEEDRTRIAEGEPTRFNELATAASEYAASLMAPQCLNWVTLNWIWF